MLVLCRKPTQQIHIGDNVLVSILGIRGNTVRIGIEAPAHIGILRSELQNVVPSPPGNFTPATVVGTASL
ncbi:MAG: carbon storage regulator [Planctomycetota bacterium]|jgi:carbon storage regulator